MDDIPARAPGESPGDYLDRLKKYADHQKEIERQIKDLERTRARVRSSIERVLIEKEVRKALRTPRGGSRGPWSLVFTRSRGSLPIPPILIMIVILVAYLVR